MATSFLEQLKKAQEQASDTTQAPAAAPPVPPDSVVGLATEPKAVIPDANVKQKYSIYLTDAQREFMENYWYRNRREKQPHGKPKKKINYSDIIAEALDLLAEKNGMKI